MFLGRGVCVFFIVALQCVTLAALRVKQKVNAPALTQAGEDSEWAIQQWIEGAGMAGSVLRSSAGGGGSATADYRVGESLHFFHLRAELKEQEVHARAFEFADAVGDLLRCAHQS